VRRSVDDASDNTVSGNRATAIDEASIQAGIRLTNGSNDNVIKANELSKPTAGAGIDVESTDSDTVLADNTADDNDDYGIFAAEGVTDGGGNEASGNGTDCTPNIKCS